jgi:hypothetical protein
MIYRTGISKVSLSSISTLKTFVQCLQTASSFRGCNVSEYVLSRTENRELRDVLQHNNSCADEKISTALMQTRGQKCLYISCLARRIACEQDSSETLQNCDGDKRNANQQKTGGALKMCPVPACSVHASFSCIAKPSPLH